MNDAPELNDAPEQNSAVSSPASPVKFFLVSGAAGVAATLATIVCVVAELPLWAMFIGWVAYFTHIGTLRNALNNHACLLAGLALGIGAGLILPVLGPYLGVATLPAVVFLIAIIVVSLREAAPFNNLLCYFLGLITFFAASMEPSATTFVHLAFAVTVGAVAAWLTIALQSRI